MYGDFNFVFLLTDDPDPGIIIFFNSEMNLDTITRLPGSQVTSKSHWGILAY